MKKLLYTLLLTSGTGYAQIVNPSTGGGTIPSTTSVLKGDGAGNATPATAGTDYAPGANPAGGQNGYAFSAPFMAAGDTSATPALLDYVTSTGGAGTITTPAGHALSTSGLSMGQSCIVSRYYTGTGALYNAWADCMGTSDGIRRWWYSGGKALGAEAFNLTGSINTLGSYTVQGNLQVNNGAMWTRSYATTEFANVASASTITPTSALFHITGTNSINTMAVSGLPFVTGSVTAPGGNTTGICVDFITDSAVTFNTGTGVGQFATATFTSTAKTSYRACYTPSTGLWYIK